MKEVMNKISQTELTRRDFVLGATTGAGLAAAFLGGCSRAKQARDFDIGDEYELYKPEHQIFTSCLQCNTGCGIKVKIWEDTAVKIDGNPLAPHTMVPHLQYDTPLGYASEVDGGICPKGQSGLQTVYDPYRLVKVLKRAGKRGENKWVTIDFRQAVKEIVEGGKLFATVPGEENRHVAGLREIRAIKDAETMKHLAKEVEALSKEIKRIRKAHEPEEKVREAIEAFKARNAQYLDLLIDPDRPDLGPKNNQLVFAWGRLKDGRSNFIKRFTEAGFGSINAHGHTTVCQGSLYFTGKAMSEQWEYDEKSHEVKWTKGDKFYWQADTGGAEFILFVGASPFEANYGPPGRTARITEGLSSGRLKYVVIDPRFSKTASKAWKWLPSRPGTEGAIALALIQYVIQKDGFIKGFLENANKAAAAQDGEPSWTNATWLVYVDETGEPGKFVRSHEVGLGGPLTKTDDDGNPYEYPLFVCMVNGKPTAVDPNDESNPINADLFVDTVLGGKRVKSALQLLKESAFEKTIGEWAQIAGVNEQDLIEIGEEMLRYGRRAVPDIHRGVSQHTNGFYNVFAWYALAALMGNYDYKGGLVKKSDYSAKGSKKNQPYPVDDMVEGKMTTFGISSIRHGVKYEDTSLFADGYPAKRPFYPLSSDVYQEIIPSIGDQYPYPIKALFFYMGSPVYALPAGHKLIEILRDVEKLPLFVCSDIVVGETSMYADYIFPDLTYLERWEFHSSHPSFPMKNEPIRQPAIPPLTETVQVYGNEMPISLEALLLAIAEEMELPGFGPNGFGEGLPLTRSEHMYLKMVANVAAGTKEGDEVPDASDEEMKIFRAARKHLPKTVFDEDVWKTSCGDQWWRKVVYVLNRGGRFQEYSKMYKGDYLANPYGKLVNLYSEKVATTKHPATGKPFAGIARYFEPYVDYAGNPVADEAQGYTFKLITHREIFHTKSRTASNYWLLALMPESNVLMNKIDTDRLGLKDGDEIRIVSPSNPDGEWDLGNGMKRPLVGKVKVIQGIRPGTITFPLGFGHWAYGSNDIVVDGQVIHRDQRRGKGIHANAAMRADPVLRNTPLSDPVGASVAFYDSMVKVVKEA